MAAYPAPSAASSGAKENSIHNLAAVQKLKTRQRRAGEASFFYVDHHFHFPAVKVLPGEYFVSSENMVIMTVLGSCIAACIWDPHLNIGGMNHFMLPEGDGSGATAPTRWSC
jgi:chemotaxis protein CheD